MVEKVKVFDYNSWKVTKIREYPDLKKIYSYDVIAKETELALAKQKVKEVKADLIKLKSLNKIKLAAAADTSFNSYKDYYKEQKDYADLQGWEVIITDEVIEF